MNPVIYEKIPQPERGTGDDCQDRKERENEGRKKERKRERRMERAREALRVGEEEAKAIEGLPMQAHRAGDEASFYEGFAVRGIRVDRIQPGFLSCSFIVPPRLTVIQYN